MNQKQSLEISIPSELGYEKVALSAIAVLAQMTGFSRERTDDLKTALAEAVTNAIEHGNGLNVQLPVQIIVWIEQDALTLRIIDQGLKPLPRFTCPRQQRADCRGWGFMLMKNLTDEVRAIVMPGYNELQLVMLRPA